MKKVLVMGLPGAGKTTLAREVARLLKAVHFNADEIRREIYPTLSFSLEDRIEHARRMGVLCDWVIRSGNYAIADFVCPTQATRDAFGPCFTVFVDRISPAESRFPDTAKIFEAPKVYDVRVTKIGSPVVWAGFIASKLS